MLIKFCLAKGIRGLLAWMLRLKPFIWKGTTSLKDEAEAKAKQKPPPSIADATTNNDIAMKSNA
jgi:hypothetical protein